MRRPQGSALHSFLASTDTDSYFFFLSGKCCQEAGHNAIPSRAAPEPNSAMNCTADTSFVRLIYVVAVYIFFGADHVLCEYPQ